MAWSGTYGFGNGGGFTPREPAPRRLTLEELLALQQQQFEPTPRPAVLDSVSDLDPEAKKRARMESLWAALAAMGSGLSTGNWNNAARGVGEIQNIQRGAVDEANARAEQQWAQDNQQRAAQMQAEQKRQETSAIYGMYERVTEGEDPESPFVRRAETAAKMGSMAELAKMESQEKPGRTAARARGYNPDSWETSAMIAADIQAELDKRKEAVQLAAELERRKALDPLDVALAGQKEVAQQNARLPVERELKAIWVAAEKEIARYRHGLENPPGAPGAAGGGGSSKDGVPVLAPWPGGGKILLDRSATLAARQPVGVVIPGDVELKWVQGNRNDGVPTRVFNAKTMELVGEIDIETGKITSRLPKTKVPAPLAPGSTPPPPSAPTSRQGGSAGAAEAPDQRLAREKAAKLSAVSASVGGLSPAEQREIEENGYLTRFTAAQLVEAVRKDRERARRAASAPR